MLRTLACLVLLLVGSLLGCGSGQPSEPEGVPNIPPGRGSGSAEGTSDSPVPKK